MKYGEISLAVIVICVVMLIIIPLSPAMLDFLLVVNIALSLVILLTSLYTKEPLEFSAFPSLLLITTLFRMGLNISSTRLILGNGGEAGDVIKTFGSFVIRGNIVVGFVVFLIIIIMQFIVITKGAERVAEVAARFTLDAMPGKQMAIDADMNSGLITEAQARQRRLKVQREADFYGAMDGASKFVKGDAIVSIIITVINSVGGMIVGVLMGDMDISRVISVYTLATVGDGLASQIPALLISTAMGITVTKAASETSLGVNVTKQLFSQPTVLIITGCVVCVMSLIPGLPSLALIIIGAVFIFLGVSIRKAETDEMQEITEKEEIDREADEIRKPENVYSLLQVDPIELEFGYGIIPLADAGQGGDLLDRVVMIRRQCALEMGLVVPVVRLRDNIQLRPNEYVIKIKGNEVARSEVMPDYFLAMNPGDVDEDIEGIDTVEPAFGLPAKWITKSMRDKAEVLGITVVDISSVISTHLMEVVKKYGHELMGRQEVQSIVDMVKETNPALIEEVIPKLISIGDLQKVLANLLKEGIPIRDMVTIIETIGDWAAITRDVDVLTQYVRQALKRTITNKYFPDARAEVITLDPKVEQIIADGIRQTETGSYLSIEPESIQKILEGIKKQIEPLLEQGIQPVLLTSPMIRIYVKRIADQVYEGTTVLDYNEIEQSVQLQSVGMVEI
ncbi:MAG: flagellar biosynthesis protein FlhA [Eubacteriales bacterium]|jgi:flagellar biosynthesis protein FlhA|nr:flagellar biosynthesis protein FlhA [Eubacteriales bacterium]